MSADRTKEGITTTTTTGSGGGQRDRLPSLEDLGNLEQARARWEADGGQTAAIPETGSRMEGWQHPDLDGQLVLAISAAEELVMAVYLDAAGRWHNEFGPALVLTRGGEAEEAHFYLRGIDIEDGGLATFHDLVADGMPEEWAIEVVRRRDNDGDDDDSTEGP